MTTWAIIPARGGSKGVPGKNLAKVGGRSLVRRAIDACTTATLIDRVLVSTDDPEIAAEAKASGAEVVIRPTEISGDSASSESAVLHAIEMLTLDGGADPTGIVLVQCTSPFTTSEHLDGLVGLLDIHDCSFTGVASHAFLWRRSTSNSMIGVNHDESIRKRRQELEPEFVETGNAYAMRTAGFRASGHRFFGTIGMLEIEPNRWLEIDTHADLERARALCLMLEPANSPQRSQLAAIRAVIFDFDGVLTDNKVIVHQDGTESVVANRGDGMGISALQAAGVRVLVLSKEQNPVVAARARKLSVDVVHGCDDKLPASLDWLSQHDLDARHTAFVGNDLNDVEAMRSMGFAVCPSDAHPDVKALADWILTKPGGEGAARELSDAVLAARTAAAYDLQMRTSS
jgi:YrbI family 3-deoxy-D-manno-octulosonate 8-phosphate phosphatase